MHVKDNTIRVTWQLPQCSGNIREIKVQYRKKGQSKWQWELIVATIADTEITINGLENGVEYEVRVVVVDTNGVTHETIGKSAAKAGKCSSSFSKYLAHTPSFPLNSLSSVYLVLINEILQCIGILFSN